ncbi:Hypothetical predicted protein [Pelobates cultripes]|uniref:Uncharacterized protein n=1 Tax=Pelobates cultripes TaxID=61616 RepID=A0AAD1R1C6_PELCU|nr:Hypothetical predicted protein [Pelobates cultripes]
MAAKLRPERGNTGSHPHSHSQETFDRLCSSLCNILCDSGMSYLRDWIRPVTRQRHYGLPLQTFKAAIQPRKHRRPQRRESDPSKAGACTRSYTHRSETATQPQSPSNIPKHRLPDQHVTTLPSRAKAEHHAAAQEKTKPNPAGAEPSPRESMAATETTYLTWPACGVS